MSNIIFQCPVCAKSLRSLESAAGRAMRCPFCAGRFVIPSSSDWKQQPPGMGSESTTIPPESEPHSPWQPIIQNLESVNDRAVERYTNPTLADDLSEYLPRPRLAPVVFTGAILIVAALITAGLFIWAKEARKDQPKDSAAKKTGESANQENTATRAMERGTIDGFDAIVGGIWYVACWVLPFVIAALWIFALVWVARDSRKRLGGDGGVWVIVVLLTGIVGLLIYVAARPSGPLVPCPNCGQPRLAYAVVCPHCAVRLAKPAAGNSPDSPTS